MCVHNCTMRCLQKAAKLKEGRKVLFIFSKYVAIFSREKFHFLSISPKKEKTDVPFFEKSWRNSCQKCVNPPGIRSSSEIEGREGEKRNQCKCKNHGRTEYWQI